MASMKIRLSMEVVEESSKPTKKKMNRFNFFSFILPMTISLVYAGAILFPPGARSKARIILWTNGAMERNDKGELSICPRASICSEGMFQIILIAIARMTAFASYVTMGLTFVSKMHSTINFLASTFIGSLIPFEKLHKTHKLQGTIYSVLGVTHTVVHVIRWILRHELGAQSKTRVGISGYFAIFSIIVVVWSMSGWEWRKIRWGAKLMKGMTFERRFNIHWMFLVLIIALSFHTPRSRIINLCFGCLWFLDYLYGVLFRTHRLDVVELMRISEGAGTQMLWRNPKGFNPKSGEYVRVMIPWLEEGGDQWHPFSLYLREATEEGLIELRKKSQPSINRIMLGNVREVDPSKTALLLVEFQNEFTSKGGKLHDLVNSVMKSTNMMKNTANLAQLFRSQGMQVFHAPIILNTDSSNNPNRSLGILKECHNEMLFQKNTWGADFPESHKPQPGDCVVTGKSGLDCFPCSNLTELIREKGIETLIIGGFLTNCCVESTMRTAYEQGLNVITLTDGTACKSEEEQRAAVEGTYPMFSIPMTCQQAGKVIQGLLPQNFREKQKISLKSRPSDLDLHKKRKADTTFDDFLDNVLDCIYVNEDDSDLVDLVMTEARQDLQKLFDTTQIFIAPAGDWSKGLYSEMAKSTNRGACWVRGPYTSPYFVASDFNHLVLVASGIGITPSLGVMGQFPGNTRTKVLIWAVRSRTMVKFFAPLLSDAHMVVIYYTGKEKLTDTEVTSVCSHGSIYLQQSRAASLVGTISQIIMELERREHSLSNINQLDKISVLKDIDIRKRAAWCVLYCGGSKFIKNELKMFTLKNELGWESELFDW